MEAPFDRGTQNFPYGLRFLHCGFWKDWRQEGYLWSWVVFLGERLPLHAMLVSHFLSSNSVNFFSPIWVKDCSIFLCNSKIKDCFPPLGTHWENSIEVALIKKQKTKTKKSRLLMLGFVWRWTSTRVLPQRLIWWLQIGFKLCLGPGAWLWEYLISR